jgi:probable rRNA maturation factor
MRINLHNTTGRQRVERSFIRRLVKRVLENERKTINTVNIIIADGRYLRRLNEAYFGKKRTTSVISFDLGDVYEIYVSDEKSRDSYELHYYILHGLLHLLGYEHRDRQASADMRRKSIEYLRHE